MQNLQIWLDLCLYVIQLQTILFTRVTETDHKPKESLDRAL